MASFLLLVATFRVIFVGGKWGQVANAMSAWMRFQGDNYFIHRKLQLLRLCALLIISLIRIFCEIQSSFHYKSCDHLPLRFALGTICWAYNLCTDYALLMNLINIVIKIGSENVDNIKTWYSKQTDKFIINMDYLYACTFWICERFYKSVASS